MTAILTLLLLATGTWALRVAFVTVIDVDTLPAVVRRTLDHVAPATIAALVVTAVADGDGVAGLIPSPAEAAGLLAAAAVALRIGSLLWSLVAAMAAYAAVALLLAV